MFDKPQFDKDTSSNNNQPDPTKMSVTALNCVKRGILCGVVRSLGIWLCNNVPEQKDAKKKMLTFINAIRAANDLTPEECEWQYTTYFSSLQSSRYATDPDCCCEVCSSDYLSWYTVIANLIDDVNCFEWVFTPSSTEPMTEDEKKMVKELRETREAYWHARGQFENYFRKVNQQVLKDVIVKYGTTFQQIAPDWYKSVKSACGLNQPTETVREAPVGAIDEAEG